MKYGLSETIIESLQQVFETNAKVDKAFLFGSRAKGNYRDASDIDMALKGQDLTFDDILSLGVKLDDLNLPYKIDLLDYHTIKEPALQEHIDRVGIEFYSRWKEYKLDEVYDFASGLSKGAEEFGFGYEFLAFKDIFQNYFVPNKLTSLVNSTEKERKSCSIKRGDVFLTRTSETDEDLGMSCVALKDYPEATFNGFTKRLRPNGKIEIHPEYAGFYFRTPKFRFTVAGMSSVTTRASLNNSMLAQLTITIPPINEQKTIADTLITLHNKTGLLQRQNKTLEQLAESLFRQWFVEEAEDSWAVEKLGKVFDIGIGRTPPRKEQHWFTTNPNDIKWVSIKDMGISGIYIDTVSEYLTPQAVDAFSVPIIPENTVMLSFKMTIGRLAISTEKMVSNEAIAHFKQKEGSSLFPEFLYLFLKTYSWVELGSTSSIVESINSQMIKEIEMIIPDKQKLIDFKKMIKPIFDKIKSNQTQIRTLTQTRDTLLPKLMSGEIRITP
mgnify:CR=1 FL=1